MPIRLVVRLARLDKELKKLWLLLLLLQIAALHLHALGTGTGHDRGEAIVGSCPT